MKFISAVRAQEVVWPTQRRFDPRKWQRKAADLCEDDADRNLATAGIWVFETLDFLRECTKDSSLWHMPFREAARYLLVLPNRDYVIAQRKGAGLFHSPESPPILFWDNMLHRSLKQEAYGPKQMSALLETSLEAANLVLKSLQGKPCTNISVDWNELNLLLHYVGAYQMTEDIFHYCLWLDWRIEDRGDCWAILPQDLVQEAQWESSCHRFEHLIAEEALQLWIRWSQSPQLRQTWAKQGGQPQFHLRRTGDLIWVDFAGRDVAIPSFPPSALDSEAVARKFYADPLLHEPLPAIGGQCALDLLRVQFLLENVAELLVEMFPGEPEGSLHLGLNYSPIVLRKPLVKALSKAMCTPEHKASLLIDSLTVTESDIASKGLWFHPLISIETSKGTGLLFAFLPLLGKNPHRLVDYWLSKLGLPLEKRGRLFEQRIVSVFQKAAEVGEMRDHAKVIGPIEFTSPAGLSEEIDVVLLLYDMIVIGEAKCQKLPVSPVERRNYTDTLLTAASQAKRKAQWARENLQLLATRLGVDAGMLSGEVAAVVISNHSPGIGLRLDGVPVLDMLLVANYLSRPFYAARILDSRGVVEVRGPPFYRTPEEMARLFPSYAQLPPSIFPYQAFLKEEWVEYPLRRDKKVVWLTFSMDQAAFSRSLPSRQNTSP